MRRLLMAICFSAGLVEAQEAGRAIFETRCGVCHGADGNGGEFAPSILSRLPVLGDAELTTVVRSGVPGRGMPAVALSDREMTALLTHLRTLRAPARARRERAVRLQLTSGETLAGVITGE